MYSKYLKPTSLDIVLIRNYKNPNGNSLKEFREDISSIENLKRYVKNFFVKKNQISFKKLLNNFIFISNIFQENSYEEVLNYIAYKYFCNDEDIFEYYVNIIYFFFDIKINEVNNEYLSILEMFEY